MPAWAKAAWIPLMAKMNAIHARGRGLECQREERAFRRFRRGEDSFADKMESSLKQIFLTQPRLRERRLCCLLNNVSLIRAAQKLHTPPPEIWRFTHSRCLNDTNGSCS